MLVWASALLLAGTAPAYDSAPWLADLAQARAAVDAKYANRDWLVQERGFDLDGAFARAHTRLQAAASDAEARRIVERLFERFRDGHVAIEWPAAPRAAAAPSSAPAPLCTRLGYDAGYLRAATMTALSGYAPLPGNSVFEAGVATVGDTKLGLLRIGLFMPEAYPALCDQAMRELQLPPDAPCDAGCSDRIVTRAYALMTDQLMARAAALKAAGAQVLLLDLSDNGGGSEWAEAAARTLSSKRLVSARRAFMRGPHWAGIWRRDEALFRAAAGRARGAERARLLGWTEEARRAAFEAERNCTPAPDCPRLVTAGFATGKVGSAAPGEYRGKPWADHAFSITQHAYREGVWDGPLLVLVDGETWSAAEEVAAMLQDNDAAVVIGARTGGAGCGYVNGGTPTVLGNSKAVLKLPDCVRLRRDGSNEVDGIVPDIAVALRADDGRAFKARLLEAALPEAIMRAVAQR